MRYKSRLVLTALAAAATSVLAGTAFGSTQALAETPNPVANPTPALTERDLSTGAPDAFGNRQSGSWTVAPDGSRTMVASAASDCYSGQTCLFQNGGFSGWVKAYTSASTYNLAYPYDNAMSSWINLNPLDAAWYTGANASGTKHCMPSGYQVANVLASENDTASSVRVLTGAC